MSDSSIRNGERRTILSLAGELVEEALPGLVIAGFFALTTWGVHAKFVVAENLLLKAFLGFLGLLLASGCVLSVCSLLMMAWFLFRHRWLRR